MKLRKWFIGVFGTLTLGLLLFVVGYIVIYLNGYKILMSNLEKLDLAEATVVYDKNGDEWTKLFMQNRELVTLEEVPDLLEDAIIATEDQRFYEHAGVDLWSLGRALVKDIIARDLVEGGSTITQQLAKNLFLSADKTFFRKATEMSIALALDNNFSKDKILEMYLNRIYYGNGAYGVKAAAKLHFNKDDLDQLNLLEIAVLAGMPKAPETYSPTNNPEKAVDRASIVLALMRDQGYITEAERREALNAQLGKPAAGRDKTASAMKDYILAEAARVTGMTEEEIYIGGYKIHTTVDPQAQRAMDRAFADPELFPEDGPEQIAQGAMVIVDPKTGGVAAMNGGRNYVQKGWNRAIVKRQPGSAFKSIAVYAPALETGNWQPYSRLRDEKLSFGDYSPSNLSGKYAGEVTMMEAVKRSINVPAVWLLNEIGVDKGLQFARKLGIDMDAADRNLAIALGGLTHGATPLEMARAYGAFANDGMLAQTHVITKVLDSDDLPVYEFKPAAERVMSERTAYYMTVLLESVTSKGGTGTRANFGRPVAGKTGTTQLGLKGVKDSAGNRDIWFVGYTPEYAAAVWMGFDDTNANHFVKTGSGTAAAMFATVMKAALEGREVQDFRRPKGVEEPQEKQAPPAVTDLSGTYDVEQRGALLSWSPVEGGEGAEYRVYRKEASESEARLLTSSATTTILDISALPGMTYQYYVTVYAAADDMESEPSNTVEVAVPAEGESEEGDMPVLPDVLPGQEGEGEPNEGEPADGGGEPGAGDVVPPVDENGSGGGGGEADDGASDGNNAGGAGGVLDVPLVDEPANSNPSGDAGTTTEPAPDGL
ncbi:PBP1A family penicillin-binding protein [Paenibacillus sp.]|uniref:transglycosylase domain-containing protein n=1 Tax=Paenibacillus sp. TaxID=58172 RepID=UPI002D30A896|nr:PBP1A family penicillin-binding protein [Paenibacillus sp.]HZG88560.1 PBP1A family penicillin-binding protein [Paenibacillus sp.]